MKSLPAILLLLVLVLPTQAQDARHYVRFQAGETLAYGELVGETVYEHAGYNVLEPGTRTGRTFPVSAVKLLSPIDPAQVPKVIGVAVNTRGAGRTGPVPNPRWFAKMPTSLRGPGDAVELPEEAGNLNYEGELVLVIGKGGRHIPEADAMDHIFGVTVGNDFSENTWYGERAGLDHPTRLISKGTDSWAPIGPAIVTGVNYLDLGVEVRLNGEVVQTGRTTELANGVPNLISYISRYMTLQPGDLIFTGTVGRVQGARRVMEHGDEIDVEIEHLGTLTNTIVNMMDVAHHAAPSVIQAPTSFEVDASWPKPLPNNWILGQASGVDVDADGNIWVLQRPLTLSAREAGLVQDPPISSCCRPAPSVIQFSPEGDVLRAWGGPDSGMRWPRSEHGLVVDPDGNIWIGSNGGGDQVVMKFTPDGKKLLQIGEWGETGGSDSQTLLGQPADIAVVGGEAYIADGYGNRRIVVFDAETGAYKRHWGAYGAEPHDDDLPAWEPGQDQESFRSPVHGVRIADDGKVYVADRVNNRVQVFTKDGEFLQEGFVAPNTRAMGSVWDIELSRDADQTYLYVPDGTNQTVWVLLRSSLEVVGSFGRGGRQAGQFGWLHNLAMDAHGNVYTTEVDQYKRVQKFRPVRR
ncbi:MAG: fumarylacetoacetate hydrolase family protein [Rhodothermales bacterium]|nr:fumarylacetoacetate hydrolase family protein [Rhodothermales bacterium]MBO6780052.1 fumarylacetoacetate hydrolase family protein [Rhodothermales bacterium]